MAPTTPLVIDVRIDRTSTVGQVVDALRASILDGRVGPGTPLRESELGRQLDVSRGTVREALRVLGAEGLAEHRAHRGVIVPELDPASAAEIFRARAVLERAGVAVVAVDPEPHRAGLEQALSAMRRATRAHDIASFVDSHAELHAQLVRPLRSSRLERFHRSLEAELRLSLVRLERLTGSLRRSLDDHTDLVRAITGGDPAAADSALAAHLDAGAADMGELGSSSDPTG